jgi:hypothetical protein
MNDEVLSKDVLVACLGLCSKALEEVKYRAQVPEQSQLDSGAQVFVETGSNDT